ncbi:4-hydroxybenzoate octaprenyltransferase [Neoehrlichia mikurensis]|uniref:4-hydroxybenzoate octaprenyltransferase n=2 Tax=Neoehrlichia mikurensis TaxID=89586 RepID=A0A9Q9F565_9RICK|nr:4-hydroxybenzoate octaprenyltransferase [Neoehrlichia mikurensis]QXK91819.1 4-hydroxybenzoate octaprenyltransferase [Neoehrlichia mikurensis]QXK93032.1 4-hydroxybenzoate octaprenyltransferase [Neoehrlichia mikurensis]QXK94105.1 4-hydroxybenzoate octaprenyltransferase [Neoehrlichia mikurensis]UTO55536.1 4-hydroxybenzoate octaprenyltransferase [Neoehrlichia mikurensis]UTO56457.1 4-hydroxybenzoate octaprenyltransferase [Neoehrlichia mikurensis]
MINKLKMIDYRAYYSLLRLHSAEIALLMLFPACSSIVLVSNSFLYSVYYCILSVIGAFVMRSAGCIINDIFDRKIDLHVERTKDRPLANGTLTVMQAIKALFILLMIACVILLLTNMFTFYVSFFFMIMIILYPLGKRYFWYPQVILGFVANSGVLIGCAMVMNRFSFKSVLLYIGCIFWTIGYDTIYAHQDKKDDAKLCIKSTALKFGENTKFYIGKLYMMAITMWVCMGIISSLNYIFYLAMCIIIGIFYYQYKKSDFDDPAKCIHMFKMNIYVGMFLFFGICFGKLKLLL